MCKGSPLASKTISGGRTGILIFVLEKVALENEIEGSEKKRRSSENDPAFFTFRSNHF